MNAPRRVLIALFASSFLQLAASFMLMPWLLYRLSETGTSIPILGVFASTSWIGMVLVIPLTSTVVQRLGRQHALWLASLLSTVASAGFIMTTDLACWFGFALIEGLASGLRWVLGEAMVVELAAPERRGRCVGLYESMVGSTFLVGPLLLGLLGTGNPMVPWCAWGVMSAALALTLGMGPVPHAQGAGSRGIGFAGLGAALRRHPTMALIGLVGGFFEGGISTVLPLYGLSLGFDAQLSTWLVTSSGLASAVVVFPAGLLVDRLCRHHRGSQQSRPIRAALMLWCTGLMIALTFCIPWLSGTPWLALVVAFAWGGAGGCLYTLAVIDIGERETGLPLFQATAVLVLAYTLGAVAGPLLGGAAMQWWPSSGFPLLLAIVSGGGWWALKRMQRRSRAAMRAPLSG